MTSTSVPEEMRVLVEMFPAGYEGSERRKGDSLEEETQVGIGVE